MTNSKLRTWDDVAFFRKGTVIKTKNANPYKTNTIEYNLVEYVVGLQGKRIPKTIGIDILKNLKEKKFFMDLDPWSLYALGDKAVWLSLNAGCIRFRKQTHTKNFAVYLESGLLDLFHEPAYFDQLIKDSPNLQKLEHLKQVALICSDLKKQFGLPTIKKTADTIEISNLKSWIFDRAQSIPIQTWHQPHKSHICADTRGIFHHIGDQMAFICSAIQYGSCYIVGSDEFGDLTILAVIHKKNTKSSSFHLGEVCDAMDFDYVYGVNSSNPMYPSYRHKTFNYSSETLEQCQFNNSENLIFGNQYWRNEYFQQQAQRNLEELSVKQFTKKLISCIQSLMSEEDYESYKSIFSNEFIKQMCIVNCYDSHLGKAIFMSKTHNFEDFFQCLKNTNSNFVYTKIEPNKNELKELYTNLAKNINDIKKLIDKYESLFNEKFSFFYKTVSHKTHCDIINPKKIDSCGFFKKDGDTSKIQNFSLWDILSGINIKQEIATYDFNEISNCVEKSISQKNNLFFDRHKDALKHSISSQVPNSDKLSSLIDFWDELDVPSFVVSDTIDMQNEYRVFVINNRPASATACFRNTTPFNAWNRGRFDPRLCNGHSADDYFLTSQSRQRTSEYARYAKKFAREIKLLYPNINHFVLDLAYSEDANNGKGGVVPIEINSVTWSGAYQIDFRRVCAAIARVPYHFSDMNNLGDFNNLLLNAKQKLDYLENIKDDINHMMDMEDYFKKNEY